jgi:hypothetical protein
MRLPAYNPRNSQFALNYVTRSTSSLTQRIPAEVCTELTVKLSSGTVEKRKGILEQLASIQPAADMNI